MGSIGKSFSSLLIVLLAVSSLIMATPAFAQTPTPTPQYTPTPAPTIPEPTVSFTLWYTNSPVIQPPANRTADIPPICEIVSPENQTLLQASNFTLNVNVASYFWVIDSVYYEADWIEGSHQIFGVQPNYIDALNASITVNFTEIPDGNHAVTVYANTHDGSHSFATVTFQIVSSPSTTPTPTSTPTVPEFPTWIILPLFAGVILLSIVARKRKSLCPEKQYSTVKFSPFPNGRLLTTISLP